MITLLHGDDIVSSRNRLTEVTSEFDSVTVLSADKVDFTQIVAALSSSDLFVVKKCVVIEHISKLAKSDLEKVLPVFAKAAQDDSLFLVLWNGTEMTKLQIGKFKDLKVESFVLSKLFFTFLDNLAPHSMQRELKLLTDMKTIDPMQIFYALIKRVRQLLMIQSGGGFEELQKMSPWQANKLHAQSAQWKSKDLGKLYSQLFTLETDLKSGGLMLPLKKHLDIVLVSQLH